MKRYRATEVEHGWVVGLVAIDTDDTPTVCTEKGAKDWAERLNETADDTLREVARYLRDEQHFVAAAKIIDRFGLDVDSLGSSSE